MVEKVFISPNRVRAYGNIINMKTGDDFTLVNSELTVTTDTVDGAEMTVFSIEVEPHISLTATNPYMLSGETTDLVVSLVNEFGSPVRGKTVTVTGSDGSLYNGITNSQGIYTLYNVEVSSDTTFTATYGTVTASCTVEYCTFVDYMTIKNNQSDGYHIINGSYSLDDNGMTIIASTYENKVYKANVRIDGDNVCTVPFEISFDLISCSSANTMKLYAFNNGFSTTLVGGTGLQLQNDTITPIRFIVESDKITKWIGTTSYNITPSTTIGSTVGVRFGYWESYPGEAKIRNFRIKPL